MIKILDFDFNDLETPYKDLKDWNLERMNSQIYCFARIIMLDLQRAGASLFYRSIYLSLSSLILAHYMFRQSIVPGRESTKEYVKKNIYRKHDEKEEIIGNGRKVQLKGLPPCFLLKLPSFNKTELQSHFDRKSKQTQEEDQTQEEEDFQNWLDSFNKNLKISKIYEAIEMLLEMYERNDN